MLERRYSQRIANRRVFTHKPIKGHAGGSSCDEGNGAITSSSCDKKRAKPKRMTLCTLPAATPASTTSPITVSAAAVSNTVAAGGANVGVATAALHEPNISNDPRSLVALMAERGGARRTHFCRGPVSAVKRTLNSLGAAASATVRPHSSSSVSNGGTTESRGKMRATLRRNLEHCDNSDDSGLGFDQHSDAANQHHPHQHNHNNHHHQHQHHHHHQLMLNGSSSSTTANGGNHLYRQQQNVMATPTPTPAANDQRKTDNNSGAKRLKMDVKLEDDEINDAYSFPDTAVNYRQPNSTSLIRTAPIASIPPLSVGGQTQSSTQARVVPRCNPLITRQVVPNAPVSLTAQLSSTSRFLNVCLTIVRQPEQQHRARYQTEGSRGAVKDREGNGFPIVQLTGYYQPTTLQVFIGTDVGKVVPHMFYQACKVSGKNSTPCSERKLDGTSVIELQLEPAKDMSATCDCVGILKERNVDVEHRFPDQLTGRNNKKKSTRCRMIFRAALQLDDGTVEYLQVCSQPIVCTQPPGVPEICKKSLTSCPASGGLELFVLGKNFLKDTKVVFQLIDDERHVVWEQSVAPDKEYLQQTHFVCVVPPYRRPDLTEPVTVRLSVVSSGKTSESHQFVYTPVNGAVPSGAAASFHHGTSTNSNSCSSSSSTEGGAGHTAQFFNKMLWSNSSSSAAAAAAAAAHNNNDLDIMPPPDTSTVPLSTSRRSSLNSIAAVGLPTPEQQQQLNLLLKREYIDENSQSSVIDQLQCSVSSSPRFRHLSESSLDVHQGDSSNMSLLNDSSLDHLMEENNSSSSTCSTAFLSRRNSLNSGHHQFSDNSMDVNLSNSHLTNEDTSSSLPLHVPAPPQPPPPPPPPPPAMDLRMKIAAAAAAASVVATVSPADLGSTAAPSIATLRSFGVTDVLTPLPAQSAQSIESFLTRIEAPIATTTDKLDALINSITSAPSLPTDSVNTVNNNGSGLCTSAPSTMITTTNVAAAAAAVAAATDLLTQAQQSSLIPLAASVTTNAVGAALAQASPSMTSRAATAVAVASDLLAPVAATTTTTSSMLSLAAASPGATTTGSSDLLAPKPPPLIPLTATTTNYVTVAVEPENAVLLNAAADLLATTKKLSELDTVPSTTRELNDLIGEISGGAATNVTSTMVQPQQLIPLSTVVQPIATVNSSTGRSEDGGEVVIKCEEAATKKGVGADDRMIPPAITQLTENELMNLINPSCFEQSATHSTHTYT